ncbi:DUF2339 domain-containing protein [Erythrobacter litoralis]|uniref:DUF2339 domain-containing protein n=1 Tax=Erythrobacter litoralis TaxID=39960 RepID=UPI002434E6D5|nr:DUF2339 domain-containing protein [Erythrobacter litoralis]MDG6077856.1 DUF2339 domain-containing protein [Erythrobacter litoralis]
MEWLLIILLGAVSYAFHDRLKKAEARIDELEAAPRAYAYRSADAQEFVRQTDLAPAPEPEPVVEEATRANEGLEETRVAEPVTYRFGSVSESNSDLPEDNEEEVASRRAFDPEDLFRKLAIWLGGITLAVAGVLLVRYSIDQGLLTPIVRVFFAFLFGVLLLAAAELAYRFEARVQDERVRQALAGAGLATLYAAFYLAGTQYGLIGQTVAFLGLALVTAAAIGLSFRFGLPSAILGLVGGFAAPLLVGGEEANLPLLSLYLGLVTAGLAYTGRRQGRSWLGIAALVGGLGWGGLLLLSNDWGASEILAFGLYLLVLGSVVPALVGGAAFERPVRLGSALVASVQLALMVEQAGFAPLAWGLYLLLGAALAFFAWRRLELRGANVVAATVAILLLAAWHGYDPRFFAAIAAAIAVLFAGVPLAALWRGVSRRVDLLQVGAVPLALSAVLLGKFCDFDDAAMPMLAFALTTLAALPAVGTWLRRADFGRDTALLCAIVASLAFAALLLVTPSWSAPIAASAVAGALLAIAMRTRTDAAVILASGAGAVVLASLMATPDFTGEAGRLYGEVSDADRLRAVLRWLSPTALLSALAWKLPDRTISLLAECVAAVLIYGTLAQIASPLSLAWMAALSALAAGFALRSRPAAGLTFAAIAAGWSVWPILLWFGPNIETLGGAYVRVGELPSLQMLALRVLPVLACFALPVFGRLSIGSKAAPRGALAVLPALVIVHTLYRQVFGIDTVTQFVSLGLAERTVWEGLLLAVAWLSARGAGRLTPSNTLAAVFAGAALAHFLVYTGLMHNPLWTRQAVGPVPLANLALAAYTVAIGAVLSLKRWVSAPRGVFDAAVMALVTFGALTLLRQAFAGSILINAPLGQTEDLLRSLLGIVLAVAFLSLGSRRGERSWRLGSLALILVTVIKVFLFDTAGLEGLVRIASFVALGASLIAIGWFYSRQLRSNPAA